MLNGDQQKQLNRAISLRSAQSINNTVARRSPAAAAALLTLIIRLINAAYCSVSLKMHE
jgi:hypothetical protein